MSLSGAWNLRIDPQNIGSRKGWHEAKENFDISIQVPGSVWSLEELSREYSSFKQPNDYDGSGWYQKKFDMPEEWNQGRVWVKFGGISPTAHIWLNGHYIGFHQQPLVGFKCDVTEYVVYGQKNVLTIELTRWNELDRKKSIVGGLYHSGPGLYLGVELEQTADIRIEELFIRPRIDEMEAWVSAVVHNDGTEEKNVTIEVEACSWPKNQQVNEAETLAVQLAPGESKPVSLKIDMKGCDLWTYDNPSLYVLSLNVLVNGAVIDSIVERFGMRCMTVENKKLVLNHEPLMWRTSSPEFNNSPTISPILDKEIIRSRIKAMKAMGFNGNRLHTHIYPREALDICDEMGFLLQVEPSVVSNFHELTPYPENRTAFINKVKEVRNHPSVVVICMGNENSQIMRLDNNKERVKTHLEDIRELVPDHLILSGCGYQGEFPDVYNAFQTPHLWSCSFKWAYGGLTGVPWAALKHLTEKGPIVIHEYGKYTVWPDPAEDELFRKYKMPLRGNYGEMGLAALKDAGIEHLIDDVLVNSRKLSAACTKVALEAPRRLPRMQGYQYHCAFRVGNNRGFIDDFGHKIDPQFTELVNSNGDVALLIDRDFRWRSLQAGNIEQISFYLSHFGKRDIANAILDWKIVRNGELLESGDIEDISFTRGRNDVLGKIEFTVPLGKGKFQLKAALREDNKVIAQNNWDFWSFPQPFRKLSDKTVIAAKDFQWEFDMLTHFPVLRREDDFTSVYAGGGNTDKTKGLKSGYLTTVISDQWTDMLNDYVSNGGTAVLLDRNNFPEEWYAENDEVCVALDKYYCDTYKMYAPFRSGWDHGNAATIIHKHPMLESFPHEGWCDLDFFDMIEGARSLKTHSLPGKVEPVIRVIPISRLAGGQIGPAPADDDCPRRWTSEDRCYLAEAGLGKGRLVICTLRLINNIAGKYLLENILRYVECT